MGYEPDDADANRLLNMFMAVTDESPPEWWYLSFVDTSIAATIPEDEQRPGGPSWLGACYVRASNGLMAVAEAHRLGCNPGGEVAIFGPVPEDRVPLDQRHRLLSLDEVA